MTDPVQPYRPPVAAAADAEVDARLDALDTTDQAFAALMQRASAEMNSGFAAIDTRMDVFEAETMTRLEALEQRPQVPGTVMCNCPCGDGHQGLPEQTPGWLRRVFAAAESKKFQALAATLVLIGTQWLRGDVSSEYAVPALVSAVLGYLGIQGLIDFRNARRG